MAVSVGDILYLNHNDPKDYKHWKKTSFYKLFKDENTCVDAVPYNLGLLHILEDFATSLHDLDAMRKVVAEPLLSAIVNGTRNYDSHKLDETLKSLRSERVSEAYALEYQQFVNRLDDLTLKETVLSTRECGSMDNVVTLHRIALNDTDQLFTSRLEYFIHTMTKYFRNNFLVKFKFSSTGGSDRTIFLWEFPILSKRPVVRKIKGYDSHSNMSLGLMLMQSLSSLFSLILGSLVESGNLDSQPKNNDDDKKGEKMKQPTPESINIGWRLIKGLQISPSMGALLAFLHLQLSESWKSEDINDYLNLIMTLLSLCTFDKSTMDQLNAFRPFDSKTHQSTYEEIDNKFSYEKCYTVGTVRYILHISEVAEPFNTCDKCLLFKSSTFGHTIYFYSCGTYDDPSYTYIRIDTQIALASLSTINNTNSLFPFVKHFSKVCIQFVHLLNLRCKVPDDVNHEYSTVIGCLWDLYPWITSITEGLVNDRSIYTPILVALAKLEYSALSVEENKLIKNIFTAVSFGNVQCNMIPDWQIDSIITSALSAHYAKSTKNENY